MNVHESEKIAGVLEKHGYVETQQDEMADVVVINTCAVRESAETRALGNIGAFKPLKKKKKDMIIAVCGCMTQQEKRAQEIYKKFPFVNIVFGTSNSYKFEEYLNLVNSGKKRILAYEQDSKELPREVKSYRTSGYNAWINIMYGCNNFCSYCIVPYVRGREKSRPLNEIVDECRELIKNGYKTITLLGQNVNSYGNTFGNGENNFANLLRDIDKIEGDYLLKFISSHPKDFSEEVVKVIANSKHISKMIHLPVQSGSNRILKLMNRNYTIEHYKNLVQMIKKYIPDVSLSTDIIVGFPTETDEDFESTLNLMREVKFGTVFGFIYSKRSGTVAEKMDGQVPLAVKRERVNKLLALQKQIEIDMTKEYIGKQITVLLTERKGGKVYAKTDAGANVIIDDMEDFEVRFQKVEVVDVKDTKLFAKII